MRFGDDKIACCMHSTCTGMLLYMYLLLLETEVLIFCAVHAGCLSERQQGGS